MVDSTERRCTKKGRAGRGGGRNGYLATSGQRRRGYRRASECRDEAAVQRSTFNVQASSFDQCRDWTMGLGQEGPRIVAWPDTFPQYFIPDDRRTYTTQSLPPVTVPNYVSGLPTCVCTVSVVLGVGYRITCLVQRFALPAPRWSVT